MNTAIWVVQILLALAFLGAGLAKLTQPIASLSKRMGWVNDMSPNLVRLIGLVEVLGAIGVMLPAVTGILPILTPIAASGLVLTMIGAILLHVQRSELSKIAPPVVLLLLAAFVAYGRFVVIPL